jgi:hypothetical protein
MCPMYKNMWLDIFEQYKQINILKPYVGHQDNHSHMSNMEMSRITKPVSVQKPGGAGFTKNQKNRSKTSQNLNFKTVILKPIWTSKPAGFLNLSTGFLLDHSLLKMKKWRISTLPNDSMGLLISAFGLERSSRTKPLHSSQFQLYKLVVLL